MLRVPPIVWTWSILRRGVLCQPPSQGPLRGFLKERVRKGVLPQLLTEILDTRFFVQTAMKLADRLDQRFFKVDSWE